MHFTFCVKRGFKISEFCGLTVRNLDFKNEVIRIDHQLQRTRDMKYEIVSTKTTSGTGLLTMEEDEKDAFLRILNNRQKTKKEPTVDVYGGGDFCSWIRMEIQWLYFTGKSTYSMQEESTIKNIYYNYTLLLRISVGIHIVRIWQIPE